METRDSCRVYPKAQFRPMVYSWCNSPLNSSKHSGPFYYRVPHTYEKLMHKKIKRKIATGLIFSPMTFSFFSFN